MKIATTLALTAAVALSACAPSLRSNPLSRAAADSLMISEVVVNTRGAAFESIRAQGFASRLGPDLDTVITTGFADRISPNGAVMRVEVSRLNVANSASSAFGKDVSALVGTVQIVENGTDRVVANYTIDVRAGQAAETRIGALVSTAVRSSDGFYRTLVERFGDETVARVTE